MSLPKPLTIILRISLATLLTCAVHAENLKAVTWNIEWFPGGRPNASRNEQYKQAKAVKSVLGEMNPDIFLAQEVTDGRAFNKLVTSISGMKVDVFSKFLESDGRTPGRSSVRSPRS